MLHLILFLTLNLLRCKRLDWDDLTENTVELIQIPLFRIYILRETHIYCIIYNICNHLVDGIAHVLTIQYLATLFVDDLTLLIVNLVVIKKILTDTEVVKLDLLLCLLDCIGKHLVLDLLILSYTKGSEHLHQTLRSEQTHQVILQGNVEAGFSRISLTSGTSTQLVINTSGLMTLCTDDLQTAGCSGYIIKLNISTTTCHVGCNGNCTGLTSLCYDLSLKLMELGIQYIVRNPFSLQHTADELRILNGNSTNQYRLLLLMSFLYRLDNCIEFLFLCHIYGIV